MSGALLAAAAPASLIATALLLAACGTAPTAPAADASAIAAAERKAVADTDAARRDAATQPAEQLPQ